jgi:Fe2+ or Zn2+ uptake regulation protein
VECAIIYNLLVPRPSPVSDAVRSVFKGHGKHAWSIDQLHEAVCGTLGAADYSSVFRAVSTMERDGSIRRIDLGDGKAYYEVGDEHHEHIRCDSCGRVAEVPGCVLDDATAGVQKQTGYKVTSHQLVFSGLCPTCVKTARSRA